ncbi:family 43 glycosylhydrolase [Saccharicrinis sp. FJH62]|uniref:family 43 glycosylhydrolase n=1 Tax=Saccharicrinis sp. FJH62 TaxID=3344657 RepID=UPI0035D44DDD
MRSIFIYIIICLSLSASSQTWSNPFILDNQWSLYGIGDPYLLKYNGYYYLYSSTRDNSIGVKVWKSKNLVDWSYHGLCATDAVTKTAYAPEVIFYEGSFYMYTSPGGNGHYILKSDSPTGMFEVVTNNLGHSIDGSVFIDDDGSLYFYHAGGDGIHAHNMSSPTIIGSDIVLSSTRMNGWTEGPCVIKRNGKYYMIYTGNHVISKGYRINAAKSTRPTSWFNPIDYNPVILSAEGDHVGLGHGSLFIGPDLDSHYITYHNLAGDYGVGPYRNLNFDRVAFNGEEILVLGPTDTPQEVPLMPDFFDYFDQEGISANWNLSANANWQISENSLQLQSVESYTDDNYKALINTVPSDDYTAEFNFSKVQSGSTLQAGIIFNYTDDENYGIALLEEADNQLKVSFKNGGTWSDTISTKLTGVANYLVWHSIRIEKETKQFRFFVNNMLKISTENDISNGEIGYYSQNDNAKFGYCAFTNQINGNSIFDFHKPIPGNIAAVHYQTEGQDVAYHDLTDGNTSGISYRNDDVETIKSGDGGFLALESESEWLTYKTMVSTTGTYNIGIKYAADEESQLRIWRNNYAITDIIDVPATGGLNNFSNISLSDIPLEQGEQNLKFEIIKGNIALYSYAFRLYDELTPTTLSFDRNLGYSWNYADGTWSTEDGAAKASGSSKRTLGKTGWTDYMVSTDIKYVSGMNGGIIFRVSNPALGGAGNDASLGTDFYQGYFVTLGSNGVTLGKQNYDYKTLTTSQGNYTTNQWYKLAVNVYKNNIKIYVDDLTNPVIDYTDNDPFICGKAGLRTHQSTVLFDNFAISEANTIDTGFSEPKTDNDDRIMIYPNPATQKLFITANKKSGVNMAFFNCYGETLIQHIVNQSTSSLDISGFSNGIYFLKLEWPDGKINTQKIIIQR